jgi:UBX domain
MLTDDSSNGQLKEYLTAGISKADFLQRVKVALGGGHEASTPVSTGGISTPVIVEETDQTVASTSSRDQVPAEEEQSHVVRELLAERSARLESKKKEEEATEKAERAAKAKARKEALETAATDPEGSKKAADMKYALMQKKRQQDARDERARILKRVEDDKAERRAKEALRKEQAKAAMEPNNLQSSTPTQPISSNLRLSAKDQGSDCALQVRLFDGTTIRSRFSPQNTLGKDVRQWIDDQRVDGDIPYTFKQVLTPQPNKTITISEEEQSLQSLGLNPSATLILVPVKDYTSAYEGGPTSYISKGISAGVGLVSSSINMVTGTLGSLFGGNAAPGAEFEAENRSSSEASASANVRTFRDEGRNSEEHQLYNGNTVSTRVHL